MRFAILGFTISACLLLGGAAAQTPDDKRRTFRVPQNPLGTLTEHDDVAGASKSISFDRGTVSIVAADPPDTHRPMDLLIEGRDNFQKPWPVRASYEGGLGFAEGWQADLDANGTLDLILVNAFPLNGRCVDRKRLMILLLDEEGKPVPWELESIFDVDFERGGGVLELLDLNNNGRAEFVQVDCDWGNYEVAAVYEAGGAKWQRLEGDQAAPMLREYLNVAGKARDLRVASDRDRSGANHPNASASELWRTIDKFVPAERRPPVRVPPIRDGRLIAGEELEDWQRNEYFAALDR